VSEYVGRAFVVEAGLAEESISLNGVQLPRRRIANSNNRGTDHGWQFDPDSTNLEAYNYAIRLGDAEPMIDHRAAVPIAVDVTGPAQDQLGAIWVNSRGARVSANEHGHRRTQPSTIKGEYVAIGSRECRPTSVIRKHR
jgi:hypothetical protein